MFRDEPNRRSRVKNCPFGQRGVPATAIAFRLSSDRVTLMASKAEKYERDVAGTRQGGSDPVRDKRSPGLLDLQRLIGNRAVAEVLGGPSVAGRGLVGEHSFLGEDARGASVATGLQREAGNSGTRTLLAPIAVQRKVVLGDPEPEVVNTATSGSAGADGLILPAKTYRFANRAQWTKYGKNRDGIGGEVDGKWVLLPRRGMLVVGENHGDSHADEWKAIDSKWRYESGAGRSTRAGAALGSDASHAVEHAIPKAARALPEIGDSVLTMGQPGGLPAAGAPLPAGYNMHVVAIKLFKQSLVLLKSYEGHWGRGLFWRKKPPLTVFYAANKGAVDASIATLTTALGAGVMPNVTALPIWPRYNDLMDVFQQEAESKVGLTTDDSYDKFKGDLGHGARVTANARAERNDILRDKSMLDTIKSAKGSTRVFVIGDAHRAKLALHPEMQALASSGDVKFVKEEAFLREEERKNKLAEGL